MTINIVKNMKDLLLLVMKNDKIYILISLLYILSNSIIPFINIVYFKYLFDAIYFKYEFSYITKITVITLIINLVATNVQIYTKSAITLRSKWLLVPLTSIFCKKSIEMDYQYTEDQSIIQEMNRAKFILANGDNLELYLAAVNGIFIASLQLIFIAILATAINPIIILIVLIVAIINSIVNSKIEKKNYYLHKESLPVDTKWRYIINLANDLKYAKEVRLFSLKKFIIDKGDTNRKEYFGFVDAINNNEKKGLLLNVGMNIMQEISVMLLLVYSVIFKGVTIGNFNALVSATGQFNNSFIRFFDHILNLYTINHYVNDFFEFLNRKSNLQESSQNIKLDVNQEAKRFECRNVCFHYPNDSRLILKNINLIIEPGECLVIVGENGAGKTTLIKLLMRLYDVTSGEILYNNINIKDYNYNDYMKILSTVFQDYKIFATSVYENITFKTPQEKDHDLQSLLEQNQLLEKIESMPHQEKTILSREFDSDGVELSGGQSQRIAFCRALYKKSPIIILDEPSASLSPVAENELYIQFAKVIKNKTTIFISHRLSSSTISDKICVLDNGEIIEYGTHNELLNKNGIYKNMYELQSKYYKDIV